MNPAVIASHVVAVIACSDKEQNSTNVYVNSGYELTHDYNILVQFCPLSAWLEYATFVTACSCHAD